MSNPSRKKGTAFERRVLENYLWRIWPKAERAPLKGVNDFGDFVSINGWLVEAKWRTTVSEWRIPTWVRTILRKREEQNPLSPWMLVIGADRRKKQSLPFDLVVISADQYFDQLARLRACRCHVKGLES